jgi:hypothetical protein
MFVVTEAEATAIRAAFERGGELSAAVELRRLFPSITDNAEARNCARTIARGRKVSYGAGRVELVRVFKTPTTPGGMIGHWLRWLIEHEEQQSPK